MTTHIINAHPETIRYPLVEKPFVGFLLALMAGSMNAWTYAEAQTFATVQSGNIVQSGFWLIQGNWGNFAFPFISVLFFGFGSAFCGVIMTSYLRKGKVFSPTVLTLEAVFLFILWLLAWSTGSSPQQGIDPHYIAYGISFVAGMQGNAYHKNHGMLYGAVAVTFVVQMAFNFLTQSFFKKEGINGEPNLMWAGIFFLVLFGFAGGGAIGWLADQHVLKGSAILIPMAIAVVLAIIAKRESGIPGAVDPSPGGTFA